MSLVIFIAVLALLIISHELGHFGVAKFFGIKVEEFGLGFPPRIFGLKRGETMYSVNWLPLGGFVKILGENGGEVETAADQGRQLTAKSKPIQAAVLVAGVTCNLILAWLLIAFGFSTVGLPTTAENVPTGAQLLNPETTVVAIKPGSPAEDAGLKTGDKIISLSAQTKTITDPSPAEFINFVQEIKTNDLVVVAQRGKEREEFTLQAERGVIDSEPTKLAVGVGLDRVGTLKLPLRQALGKGLISTYIYTKSTVVGLWGLLSEAVRGEGSLAAVSGPVGLVTLVGEASALGLAHLIFLTAIISINLAVLNLLPVPALDGGRLVMVAVEALRGKPLSAKFTSVVNYVSFCLLILFMLVVTFSDITKLF